MAGLASAFGGAILPIVAVAAVGALLGRRTAIDPGPLTTATVYVLAPALVFDSLATTTLGGGALARVTAGVVVYTAAMLALAEAVGRLLGAEEPTLSAFVLVGSFSNAGNYGLPLTAFAFGVAGRSTAALYLAVQGVLMYTVGLLVAARGGGTAAGAGLRRALRVPLAYAVVLAVGLRWLSAVPPEGGTVMRTVGLVGDAAIPVMLLLLGVQLARTDRAGALSRALAPGAVRLGVGPVVGVGLAFLLGFEDPTVARAFALECAMPAAITPLILVAEFGDREAAGYVSASVLVTTLVSVPLLTAFIALLQSGAVL